MVPETMRGDHPDPAPAAERLGETLKQARERLSLSRHQAAQALRLPVKTVFALEEERHAELPEPAYVKGYIRAYARLLNLDHKALIERYAAAGVPGTELSVDNSIGNGLPNQRSVGLNLGVVVLVWVVLSAVWWISQDSGYFDTADFNGPIEAGEPAVIDAAIMDSSSSDAQPTVADEEPWRPPRDITQAQPTSHGADASGLSPSAPEMSAMGPLPTLEAAVTPNDEVSAVDVSPLHTEGPEVESADQIPARDDSHALAEAVDLGGASAPNGVTVAGPDVLRLDYNAESWTEVQDANGARLLYGLVPAGEVRRVEGAAPFRILLGNSRGVQVTINGQRFDHLPFARKNDTARFSVDRSAAQ